MKNALRRLRLKTGDIVIVRDRETMKALTQDCRPLPGVPDCPVIYCPGSVHRLSKEYLQKLLEKAT